MPAIALFFNIFCVIVLVLMLLKGYLSGLWKSLVSLGIIIIGMIILIIVVNVVGKSVTNPDNITKIQELLYGSSSSEEVFNNPAVTGALLGVSAAVIKLVVFFTGMLSLVLFFEPIISLIVNSIVFSKTEKHEKRNKKTIGIRLGGLGVKLAQFFIIMFAVFLPVFGANALVVEYQDVLVEAEMIDADDETFNELKKIDKSFVKAPINILNSMFNTRLEVNMLGSIASLELEGNKVNFIKEAYNAKEIVGVVFKLSNEEIDTTEVIVEENNILAEYIRNSTILEEIYPSLINALEAGNVLNEDSVITYDMLKSIDFSKDKDNIANIIILVGDYLEGLNLESSDMSSIIADASLPDLLEALGKELADTTFIDVVLTLGQDLLEDMSTENEEIGNIISLIDLTKINSQTISSDMKNIGILLNKVSGLEDIDNILNELDLLEEMVTTALKLSVIKGNEDELIKYIFTDYNILEGYNINLDEFDFDKVQNWEVEVHALFNLFEEFVSEEGELTFDIESLKSLSEIIQGPNGEPCYFTNYIIGCIIKEELKDVVSPDISDKLDDDYDMSDPDIFKEVKESLGTVVEVGTSISKIEDVEALTKEEITDICDKIASLDNYKSDLVYEVFTELTAMENIELDITKEEFKEASLEEEAAILEEILMAVNNSASDKELEELMEKAEEETVIIKAFIDKYFK